MTKIEKHHVIPISLGGIDEKENIMRVKEEEHQQIHNTLRIPHKHIREVRKILNRVDIDEKYKEKKRFDLRRKYFNNILLLDKKLIFKHIVKLLEQIKYYRIQYLKLKEENIKLKTKVELLETFLNTNKNLKK